MKALLALTLSIMVSVTVMAQPTGPGNPPDANIPIDGGISLLAAAGFAYGAKKVIDARKKAGKQENENDEI